MFAVEHFERGRGVGAGEGPEVDDLGAGGVGDFERLAGEEVGGSWGAGRDGSGCHGAFGGVEYYLGRRESRLGFGGLMAFGGRW